MVDPRIYRAALLPVLFALVLLAFSVANRPRPLTTPIAPDAFAGGRAFDRAYKDKAGLADRYPDRRPGSAGDDGLAGAVAAQMSAAGFRVRNVVRDGETIDGRRSLRNVIAERTGTIDERIVVVAHRDAAAPRADAELSGTAALLELARVFGAPRQTRHTLTLVSTSGGSGGAAGARALAGELGGPVGAVLVLGDLASRNVRAPLVTPWSNGLGSAPLQLRATVQESIRSETGSGSGPPRALTQFARFAFPATFGEQGVLLQSGLPAVLLSIDGDRPPAAGAPVSRARLEAFGRAALRTVTVLDRAPQGRPMNPRATSRDLLTSRKVIPGWAVRLFTGTLLLAVAVTAIDALAALMRRREPILVWLRWTLAAAVPFALVALFVRALGATGLVTAPGAPVSPSALPAQAAALLAVVLVFALGWVWLRPAALRISRVAGDPAAPGAGLVVVLLALVAAACIWAANPYAAAIVVPALHICLFALAPEFRMRRVVGIAAVALGVLPLALVARVLAQSLGLGLEDACWEALLLAAGGHVSALSMLLWSVLAGCGASALLIAARGREGGRDGEIPITVRGPASYAGPGSLGGTESALQR
ncbi:MAG: hypothetical protein QOE11_2249 [Solirubrobacteraceae bacterium]|jgi:hypothetical protein|nr:hypothetical protein [Solirubrobacteraceae bacterium]